MALSSFEGGLVDGPAVENPAIVIRDFMELAERTWRIVRGV